MYFLHNNNDRSFKIITNFYLRILIVIQCTVIYNNYKSRKSYILIMQSVRIKVTEIPKREAIHKLRYLEMRRRACKRKWRNVPEN